MLLGSKYQLLTLLAQNYVRHNDGLFVFSLEDFKSRFPDVESFNHLKELEIDGFVEKKAGFIRVDSNVWVNFFVGKIEYLISQLGYRISCSYNKKNQLIEFYEDKTPKIAFDIGFSDEGFSQREHFIKFHCLSNEGSGVAWLELLNDRDLLIMFCKYITKEITSLLNEQRISFNFFEGLPDEDISEIYNLSIRNYFLQNDLIVKQLSDALYPTVGKLIRKTDFEAMEVQLSDAVLVIVKVNRKIEFLSFKDSTFRYTDNIREEIDNIRDKILAKVNEYRKITRHNRLQVVENINKAITILTVILTLVNTWLLYAISNGAPGIESFFKNSYYIDFLGVVQLVLVGALFWLVFIPVVRLGIFNWEIENSNKGKD